MKRINSRLFFLCLFGLSIAQTSVSRKAPADNPHKPGYKCSLENLKLCHLFHKIGELNLNQVIIYGSPRNIGHLEHKAQYCVQWKLAIPEVCSYSQVYTVSVRRSLELDVYRDPIEKVYKNIGSCNNLMEDVQAPESPYLFIS